MGRYRVCVYAICKNEEKFVEDWVRSMQEADWMVVLDTGSADATVERLRERGVQVTREIISPWRFDTARNRSLELVPPEADICVCVDLDERFHPGWRAKLEAAWQPDTCRARYRYTWSFNPDGSEGCVFWLEKIHARRGFYWEHPVHEVLCYTGPGPCNTVEVEGMQLDHHPDPTKSRAQYLPLLELSVQEKPEDDRNMHYLGREYLFRGQWDRCIQTLQRHLAMPQATWRDERCASMRYIARAWIQKGDYEQARIWYLRAVAEAPYLREPYVELAWLLSQLEEWHGVLWLTGCALKILQRPRTYICEASAWGSLPYDLAALGYYHTGDYSRALGAVERALALSPSDERLKENRRWIQQAARDAKMR